MNKRPNFFLVGGAKCGTTSLAKWLADHPNIYVPEVKEPDFFYPGGKIKDKSEYMALFDEVEPHHHAVGEASIRYLSSEEAIQRSYEFSGPNCKYIVIVRNPIDMAISLHAQRLKSGNENIRKFEKAWHSQRRRQEENKWPDHWYTPEVNLYGQFCKLGHQCKNLLRVVGQSRALILFLEDIAEQPGLQWSKIQKFLDVPYCERLSFEALNQRSVPKSLTIHRLLPLLSQMKNRVGFRKSSGLLKLMHSLNMKGDASKVTVSADFRRQLYLYFADEIRILESITERDLSHWRPS